MGESIKRILVVDDEPEFAKTLQRHLKREGFFLDVAYDGEDARHKIEDSFGEGNPFDLVITDVIMPNMDGIQLLQWIKKTHAGLSVLVVSAYDDNGLARKTVRSEMDGCAKKSLTPKEMMGLIYRIERKRDSHRTMRNPELKAARLK